ncbi:hypothetical protein N7925_25370 [Streptomyces sp. CA-278952]|nr:hypothetical protein [Streptomyces sp. CA-278952]WDG31418.1 hypothetical protein N7925_25370 [Streptomyces sp. CA-278952]
MRTATASQEARRVTVPLHTNLGGHTGAPEFELDTGPRFFARHVP